jgi:nitroreductase
MSANFGEGAMTDLYAVITRQRACREFSEEPVRWEVIRRVLTAATHAPSAENSQPWRFVVVTAADRRARVGTLTRRAWESGARAHAAQRLTPQLLADVAVGATRGVATAPVLVVVGAETGEVVPTALESSIWPAVQNLLLAAGGEGLGSALTTLATAYRRELAAAVGFPDSVRPVAVVPLGWPARPLGPPRRRAIDAIASHDSFGTTLPG